MKIAFCLPHLKTSGGVRVILTYANELSKQGHQIIILAAETSRKRRLFLSLFRKKPGWFKLNPSIKIAYFGYPQLQVIISNLKPDVLVADSWLVAQACQGLTKSFVNTIQHDERLYHGQTEDVSKTYRFLNKKIVVSTWLQEMLKKDFGQESELLLNSFDREIFHSVPEAKKNDGKIRVLLLDHPYLWKGTAEGIKMVNELKNKYPNIVLMGLGARRKEVSIDFDEFYFAPPQNKLAGIYSRADIFLCPSWDEGFGLPSLEAMACGTAVVTYDNGGSRDFAHDGKTALVAPRRNYGILQNKLEQLVNDVSTREKIARGGLSIAQSWPTWGEQTKKLIQILQSF